MNQCKKCGKELQLPFICSCCGESFCAEHRLPEIHNCCRKPVYSPLNAYPKTRDEKPRKIGTCPRCHLQNNQMIKYNAKIMIFKCGRCGLRYGQKKAFPNRYVKLRRKPRPKETIYTPPRYESYKRKSHLKATAIIATLLIGLFVGVYVFYLNPDSIPEVSIPESITNILPIPKSQPNHEELVDYMLSLINIDRQAHGLQNVSLSSVNSGQQHAENMLKDRYFSHWDVQGYKPYMRYTLAGGKGSVAENCAAQLGYYSDLKEALKDMEWRMMYDDAESHWGHKDNILDHLHNKVSIGIAYDSNNIYLVQDFENDFVSWEYLNHVGSQVTLQGTILKSGLSISNVAIFFDKVGNLTTQQLSNSPYQGGYDVGTTVGMALPPEWEAGEGITITASIWSQTGQSFSISFDLSSAFTRYGNGVYTLYLMTGESTASSLTTYSIWH